MTLPDIGQKVRDAMRGLIAGTIGLVALGACGSTASEEVAPPPPFRGDTATQVHELLFRNVDAEGPERVVSGGWLALE